MQGRLQGAGSFDNQALDNENLQLPTRNNR
jgi:hypothetical protein